MKRLLALSLLIPAVSFAEILPQGSVGAVTLDWKKFDDLWTKMQSLEKKIEQLENPENLPPVPFALSKAAYKGSVQKSRIDVTALFEIDVFEKKKWVKVPFLPSSVALAEARLDGAAAGVVAADGFHEVVIRGSGRHVLAVRFSVRTPKAEEAPSFQLDTANTPMTVLSLTFPQKNLDVTLDPSQGVELAPTATGGTLVTAVIPPTSSIQVRWQKAVAEENAGPTKLYVESQQLLTLSEGTARSRWQLDYTVLHRGAREIELLAPADWNVLNVSAEGLQEWKLIESPKGPVIRVQFAYAKKGALTLLVEAERGIGEKDAVVEAPRLRPLSVEREGGTIGLEAKGAVELQVRDAQGVNKIDPRELPPETWNAATQPLLFAYRYTKPYQLAVAVMRHTEIPVLTTTIDDANAMTLMTRRGQAVTRVRYQVRNHLKQYLSVRLPEESQLWSAFVAGAPVKPISEGKGIYRLPLAKSQIESAGQAGFPVEIVYYQSTGKFWALGSKTAQFPVPDAPVSRLFWSLYVPDNRRMLHFGGDLEKGAMASPVAAMLGMADVNAGDKEAPQRRLEEFKGLRKKMGLAMKDAAAPAAEGQGSFESDSFAKNAQQLTAGVFPVAFEVPAAGQLFRFGQVMIVGDAPRLSMIYVHTAILQTIVWLLMGLAGWMLWIKRAALLQIAGVVHALVLRVAAKLAALRTLRAKEA